MHPGLSKENVGQKLVGTCRWEVKVSLITVVEDLAGSRQSLLPEGVVSVPNMDVLLAGSFA